MPSGTAVIVSEKSRIPRMISHCLNARESDMFVARMVSLTSEDARMLWAVFKAIAARLL